jgi:hypothetical protein
VPADSSREFSFAAVVGLLSFRFSLPYLSNDNEVASLMGYLLLGSDGVNLRQADMKAEAQVLGFKHAAARFSHQYPEYCRGFYKWLCDAGFLDVAADQQAVQYALCEYIQQYRENHLQVYEHVFVEALAPGLPERMAAALADVLDDSDLDGFEPDWNDDDLDNQVPGGLGGPAAQFNQPNLGGGGQNNGAGPPLARAPH